MGNSHSTSQQEVDPYEEDFANISEKFASLEEARVCFEAFPRFQEKRIELIEILEEIAGGLDNFKEKCNQTRKNGCIVGILGDVTAIIALVLPLIAPAGALALAPTVVLIGDVISAFGGLMSATAAENENANDQRTTENVTEMFEEDRKEFQKFSAYVEELSKFKVSVEKIVSFDAFQNMMDGFDEVGIEYMKLNKMLPMKKLPSQVVRTLSAEARGQVQVILEVVIRSQQLWNLFGKIIEMHQSNPLVFEVISFTMKSAVKSIGATEAAVNAARSVAAPLATSAATSAAVGEVLAHGLASGICLIFNAISLALTNEDIENGSKSELAMHIRNCATMLDAELQLLDTIYTHLKKSQPTGRYISLVNTQKRFLLWKKDKKQIRFEKRSEDSENCGGHTITVSIPIKRSYLSRLRGR